jgi:hypothetical protein
MCARACFFSDGEAWARISAWRSAILTEVFHARPGMFWNSGLKWATTASFYILPSYLYFFFSIWNYITSADEEMTTNQEGVHRLQNMKSLLS